MDLTAEFREACKELEPGEVVFHSSFSMFDAMSAIEIMEPKMDTGMLPFEYAPNLAELIADGRVNVADVDLRELITVTDATLAMIVAWLHGQPLDQTVFTNLCLLDPCLVVDRLLSGVCAAALKLVHCSKSCIETAAVAKEEDFTGCSRRLPPLGDDVWTMPLDELDSAIEFIRQRKTTDKQQSELIEAVESRLTFFQSLFDIFAHLMPSSSSAPITADAGPNLRRGAAAAERGVASATVALRTVGLGLQPLPADAKATVGEDGDFSWLPYFEPTINRAVLPPIFPRQLKLVGRTEAWRYLIRFLRTIRRMAGELPDRQRNLEGLMDLFHAFGGEDSCVLSRSFAQLLVLPHNSRICGGRQLSELIQDALRDLNTSLSGDSIEFSLLDDASLAERLRTFVTYCVHAFVGAFQLFGHNLGLQRDKMLQNCLEDFGAVQVEALEIEECRTRNLREELMASGQVELAKTVNSPTVLSGFLLVYVLRLMHYHFEIGFRLDLFVPYEFPYVYWYFGEVVSSQLASILERRCSLFVLSFGRQMAALNIKKPSKKQQLRQRAEADLRRRIGYVQTSVFRHKVETLLCRAYAKFGLAMRVGGRLPPGVFAGDTATAREMQRYALRFDAFSVLSGAPSTLSVPYELYRKTSGVDQMLEEHSVETLFSQSSAHFEDTVNFLRNLETQQEDNPLGDMTRALLKTAKQNAIVAKLLSISSAMKKTIAFERITGEDPMFPLIKLV